MDGLGLDESLILTWISKKCDIKVHTGFISLGRGPVVGCFELVNKSSCSIKGSTTFQDFNLRNALCSERHFPAPVTK
jgi:argininosuccinate synthase